MFKTIVALATPPMKSALAIIRLSGDGCFEIFSHIFTKNISGFKERTVLHGFIKSENEMVDEVVVNAYVAPNSFTGENLVEIMCHGSMLIVDEIIALLIKHGARLALNGEFSSRAFLHKRIDLIQAEAINDVINATSKEAKKLSLLSLKGDTSSLILPLKNTLADLLSLIEVNIDYPEYEDIEQVNIERIIDDVEKLHKQIHQLIAEGQAGKVIKEGIKVAIVGKPNVGKSSLLNAFLREDKAIVTDIAGTTRDIVEGEFNLQGIRLHLLDTAGIRNSDDVIENMGINKSIQAIMEADLVLHLIDPTQKKDNEDEIINKMTNEKPTLVINTKNDLFKSEGLSISAVKGDIDELILEIKKMVGISEESFAQPSFNNVRQLGLLGKIDENLVKAKADALLGLSIDLISVSLLNAYNGFLELLGETNYNDLSTEIFSRFCVGK